MNSKNPCKIELLQGTLEVLILRTLLPGPAHGHAIARHIQRTSEELLQVELGRLENVHSTGHRHNIQTHLSLSGGAHE